MRIAVDYIQGTNGSYFTYLGNVFLIPTRAFHVPFDDINRSHTLERSDSFLFECGHYYYSGFPREFTHVVYIDIEKSDLPILRTMKLAKNLPNDVMMHLLEKPVYYRDNNVFRLPWKSFFDLDLFLLELDRLCKFLNINKCQDSRLLDIHREFIQRHQFLFKNTDNPV